jgi:hypothetical protein
VSRGHCASGSAGRRSTENQSPRCAEDSQRRPKRPATGALLLRENDEPTRCSAAAGVEGAIIGGVGSGKDDQLAHQRAFAEAGEEIIGDEAIGRGEQPQASAGALLQLKAGAAELRQVRLEIDATDAELRGQFARRQVIGRGAQGAEQRHIDLRSCEQLEREIDRARGVGERADGDEIDPVAAICGTVSSVTPPLASNCTRPSPSCTASRSSAGRHIIEQDHIHTREREKAAHLLQCIGLQLHAQLRVICPESARIASCSTSSFSPAAR